MMWIVNVWKCFLHIALLIRVGKTGVVPGIKLKTPTVQSDVTEYPAVNAVVGTAVSLPCNLSPPSPDDTIVLVLVYRLDLNNPVYTLDARTSSAKQAKHFSGKVLGSRAYFNVSSHRPSLASIRIDPVEVGDAGEYRCRVDFKRGRTLARLVKLNVIVPTTSLVIKDKDNRSLSGVIGPYTEGTTLSLICQAEGGHPPPAVTWWRDKESLIDDSFEMDEESGMVRNELTLTNFRREDLMAKIICQASNTNLTAPITIAVTIDLNLKPISVQIVTTDRPLSAGERFEVTCKSEGSRPPARILWWKNDENLDHMATETVGNDITTSVLVFEPTREDNSKSLVCTAENPEVRESALKDEWTLNVYYSPVLTLKLHSPSGQHIREGSDVEMICHIHSNPPVTHVRWRFGSRPLIHDPSIGVYMPSNHSLILKDVRRTHRGGYVCIATNLEGDTVSEEMELKVQFPPVCLPRQRSVYGVARLEESNVSCGVEADPREVSFRWTFNNSLGEITDILSYSSDGSRSNARYIPRNKQDYGTLQCHARNDVGMMKEPCLFSIVPTGPPEPVQNCSVVNQTASLLIVSCDPGDDGGLPQVFHLEVYTMKADRLIANFTTTDHPYFVVEKLSSSSEFIVVVFSSNSKGKSTTVALTASTLYSAQPQTEDNHHTTISAVLVFLMGVVGALVLLAIIIILIVKVRGEKRGDREKEKKKSEEKIPTPVESSFEDKQPDIFHSKDFQTEYVDLTPNARTERIYESLGDSKEYTYENIIHKATFASNQNAHNTHIPTIVAR